MRVGDTFLPRSTSFTPHLWIIVTAVDEQGSLVMVNVTSRRTDSDAACILQRGDHPFVLRESVIAFQHAQITKDALLEQAAIQGLLEVLPAAAPLLLNRIRQGALDSRFTPRVVKAAIRKFLGIDP